ncbi:MAG: methyltransferase domain-containing protein [Planctomycetota bacterium]|jgi:hypothetical protein
MHCQGTPQKQLKPEGGFDWREYELEYWKKTGTGIGADKNIRYLEYFGAPKEYKEKTVVEIGPGPFGGVLPFLNAKRRIAVEPLYDQYVSEGLWKPGPEIKVLKCFAEAMDLSRFSVDVLFACNSLDHGESIKEAIKEVSKVLVETGYLFLHVHCRKRKQLNNGHRQAFGPANLLLMAREVGLFCNWWQIYHRDPVNGSYKAFIGEFQKAVGPTNAPTWWEKTKFLLEASLKTFLANIF